MTRADEGIGPHAAQSGTDLSRAVADAASVAAAASPPSSPPTPGPGPSGAAVPPAGGRAVKITNWPMWVVGFTLFLDGMDQYIVRGSSDQIKHAFHVNDTAIGVLFSAFILVNGIVTLPSGYFADRWNRTKAMAATIVLWSLISAVGGVVPTSAFALLVVIRASLGFGQAITDPSGSSVIADFYGTERRGKAFSIQQCLSYVGTGVGLAIGGALGPLLHGDGWRLAFFVSLLPGLFVAYLCWKLPEPSRGTADRAHVKGSEEMELSSERVSLFPHGLRHFTADMVDGLKRDMTTIIRIPTMRYALVGVSTVGFVVTAVGTWMPSFYQNQLGETQSAATATFGLLLVLGGIPGTVWGGWIADRWVSRFMGARVVIPAVCMMTSASLFVLSFIPMPKFPIILLQLLGLIAATASVPALRAGLSDAAPAQVRGAGFAAFNLASVVFGSAVAPVLTAAVAAQFSNNYRVAFLIVMPIAYVGAACLLLARQHIEKDAAKVFEAVVAAMAANQAKEAAYEAEGAEPGGGVGDT
ncbi:MAG TPA: MFS transporter [Acidimicrobiales bacterium]|nr:MFS transporter [Acidimicrobiales bacterium]